MSHRSNSAEAPNLWTTDIQPADFFRQKVLQAQERQNLKLTENVEFYLVNLLCDFMRLNDNQTQSDCLALILKQALESSPSEQIAIYKRLGDTALYFSGFFQEYFNRKTFDVKYYVMMGESAYGQLATLMRRKSTYEATMSTIFSEMSKSFPQAVDVLMDVSEHTQQKSQASARSTLSIYDAWLSTASQKLEKELHNRGINPVKVAKKTVQ